MTKKHILVIEDEEDILELIRYNLGREQYRVKGVLSGEEALAAVRDFSPDLILLDLMLPGIDGLSICRLLKNNEETKGIPIIMVTAKGEETDVVIGLELGADDYITKPFSPQVLIARIRALLRRSEKPDPTASGVIRRGDLTIHPGRHEVLVAGSPVALSTSEFRILHFLARRPGWVFTRNQILEGIHEENFSVTDRSVDVQIVSLRKKLGRKEYIETVRGIG